MISSLKTLEFWSIFYTHWNSFLSFHRLVFWPYFYDHWNSYLILPNIGILILFFQTMGFWLCFYKH